MRASLAAGIRALGLDIDDTKQSALLAYLALLEKWNRTHNLTAIVDPERMVTHHLLDSLAVLPHLPPESAMRLADVGSGGGLPGIPLAICCAKWQVTLIEASQKKAAFLRQAVVELPLRNVDVVSARAESYRPSLPFDFAISRGYSKLATFALQARHLVDKSGRLTAMKGAYPREEIDALPPDVRIVKIVPLQVPGVDAQRHLIIMECA
jgi:16S rRNA (guanine527-N7)-methyltransferase